MSSESGFYKRAMTPPQRHPAVRLALVGFGFVGRALGGVLAAKVKGAKVVAFDPANKIEVKGKVSIATTFKEAVQGASHVFICVPSHLDGKGVEGAGWKRFAKELGYFTVPETVIVIKSTLVPGDATKLEKMTNRRVVVCPEFMAEGTAERDILKPHRVLVGGRDKDAVDSVIRLYRHWVPANRIIRMDAWSAQLAKLLANAMLAQRVSSINTVAALCERGGADARAVSKAVGLDPRIGALYLQPSVGFGGSCLEKDINLLIGLAKCMGLPDVARYWRSVIVQNDNQVRRVTRLVSKMVGKGGRVAILGLAFKPGVPNLRNSAPLRIAEGLISLGHPLVAHDPKVKEAKKVRMASTPKAAAKGAKVIAVLNDDAAYRMLDWKQIAAAAAPGVTAYSCSAIIGRSASACMPTHTLGGTA